MKLNSINLPKVLENFSYKTAIVRVDYNVPVQEGRVLDDSRIRASIATIQKLQEYNIKIRLITHYGRPKGADKNYSTEFLVPILSDIFHQPVVFSDTLSPHSSPFVLYENIRFWEGEEKNDPQFAQKIASLGDFYVNDAFSVSHRAHASTEGVTKFLPSFAGLQMECEVTRLTQALTQPQPPFMAIIGGSKISTKISVLENLLPKVDACFIGGGMANTFLCAQGYEVGASLLEKAWITTAQDLLKKFPYIILPQDVVVTTQIEKDAPMRICSVQGIEKNEKIVDIGPQTIAQVQDSLNAAKTLIWNGPLGVFEVPPFHQGTQAVMKIVGDLSRNKQILSVIGGGETVAAAYQANVQEDLGFISTAGGAFLEWLEGKQLPGIIALCQNADTHERDKRENYQ